MTYRALLIPAGPIAEGNQPDPLFTLPRLLAALELCEDWRFNLLVVVGDAEAASHPQNVPDAAIAEAWLRRTARNRGKTLPTIIQVNKGESVFETATLGIRAVHTYAPPNAEVEIHVVDVRPRSWRYLVSALVGHGLLLRSHASGWIPPKLWAAELALLPYHVLDPRGAWPLHRYIRSLFPRAAYHAPTKTAR